MQRFTLWYECLSDTLPTGMAGHVEELVPVGSELLGALWFGEQICCHLRCGEMRKFHHFPFDQIADIVVADMDEARLAGDRRGLSEVNC